MATASRTGDPANPGQWRAKARIAALSLSAANLVFMNTWFEIYPSMDQYIRGYSTPPHALAALWLNILLLTVAFYGFHQRFHQARWHRHAAIFGGLALGLSLIYPFFHYMVEFSPFFEPAMIVKTIGRRVICMMGFVAFGVGAGILVWAPNFVFRCLRFSLKVCILLPFFLTWAIGRFTFTGGGSDGRMAASASGGPRRPKAIVLIFDEWDYEYGFEQRPAGIQMPAVDRFEKEYGSYPQCWPPAGETTRSLPSLATGRTWQGTRIGPGGHLLLKDAETGRWRSWTESDDLFRALSSKGWRSRMIQWWHTFPQDFRSTRAGVDIGHYPAFPIWDEPGRAYQRFWGSFDRCWVRLLRTYQALFRMFGSEKQVQARVQMVQRMLDDLNSTLISDRYDLIWAHLPIPHAPAIMNARTGQFLTESQGSISNLENMALVDRVVGQVRSTLEARGEWDDALVILTSDHWQRALSGEHLSPNPDKYIKDSGYRVPLLVKWPRQAEPYTVHDEVCNISVRWMVEAVAAGGPMGKAFPMKPPPADKAAVLLHPAKR